MRAGERHPLGAAVVLRLRRQWGSTGAVAEALWRGTAAPRDHLRLTGDVEEVVAAAWDVACEEAPAGSHDALHIARVYEDLHVRLVVIDDGGLRYSGTSDELLTCASRAVFEAACQRLVWDMIQQAR